MAEQMEKSTEYRELGVGANRREKTRREKSVELLRDGVQISREVA